MVESNRGDWVVYSSCVGGSPLPCFVRPVRFELLSADRARQLILLSIALIVFIKNIIVVLIFMNTGNAGNSFPRAGWRQDETRSLRVW